MIISTDRYVIASADENKNYWMGTLFPEWTAINTFIYCRGQKMGYGPEPHYHDCDEFWLFLQGQGHLSLDDKEFKFTPGTLVYTPMGSIHEFHSHTDFETVAVISPLERQKRPIHVHVDEEGPPEPTVPGFVVPGDKNIGPFSNRGTRCPLSELRMVKFSKESGLGQEVLTRNEYLLMLNGAIELSVDGLKIKLNGDKPQGELALLRKGVTRSLKAISPSRLAVARE